MSTNPHEGNELALLLAGTKPFAMLGSEPTMGFMQDLTAFEPHVASGRLINVNITSHDGLVIHHYFCLPTEEWRIKLKILVDEAKQGPDSGGFTSDDIYRINGWLLGYTKESIEKFVVETRKWWEENREMVEREQAERAKAKE